MPGCWVSGRSCPTRRSSDLLPSCATPFPPLTSAPLCASHPCPFKPPKQDTVLPCDQGHYSTGAQQACTPCQAGYYCTNPATAESYPCATGTYAVGGQFQCTDCAAGLTCRYSSVQHITRREFCDRRRGVLGPNAHCMSTRELLSTVGAPSSRYVTRVSRPTTYWTHRHETFCPHILYITPRLISSRSTEDSTACGLGYYSLQGEPLCTPCPAGYRCPQARDSPIACDPGYYRYISGGTPPAVVTKYRPST